MQYIEELPDGRRVQRTDWDYVQVKHLRNFQQIIAAGSVLIYRLLPPRKV